jgi:hypothetical protein
MKKMLFVLAAGILVAATSFGATNWGKSVQMDQNYVLLNRSQIILSNLLAVAAGDLSGTTNSSTVIRLQGKNIPLPGAGDGGKAYVYNSGTGSFDLTSLMTYPAGSNLVSNYGGTLFVPYSGASGAVSLNHKALNDVASLVMDAQSLVLNATANLNTGIEGAASPVVNQTNSVWMGYATMNSSAGFGNVAVGYHDLQFSDGSFNTAVGGGGTLNSAPGSFNTALGYTAGYQAVGSSNVFLGHASANFGGPTARNNMIVVGVNINGHGDNTATWGRPDQTNYFDGPVMEQGTALVSKYESLIKPTTLLAGVSTNVQLTDIGRTFVATNTATTTFSLPSVDASNIGLWYTFVKNTAAQVTIDAADSDRIADSGAGDTIYDNQAGEVYATITLQLVSETNWVVTGAMGTWTTTD